MVQGPEGRLGTQAGVYLVPAASRVSSSQPSCNLFQGKLFWSVWKPHCLTPGNLPEHQTAPYMPFMCFPFLCKPTKYAHTSFPGIILLPQMLNLPTSMATFCFDSARDQLITSHTGSHWGTNGHCNLNAMSSRSGCMLSVLRCSVMSDPL